MLGVRRPYTHEQVKVLYPVLSEVECRIVSHIENRFRWWEIYPDVHYPQIHLWYARRQFTPMPALVKEHLGDIPGEIVYWINENSSKPPEFP
jgi:hypothetical protein